MPVYWQLGEIPSKRHKVFRQPSGCLYAEELVGNMGFVGPSSLLYHVRRPTAVRAIRQLQPVLLQETNGTALQHRHFRTKLLDKPADAITGRTPLLFNSDVSLSVVHPDADVSAF